MLDALEAVRGILRSTLTAEPTISFPFAYEGLLMLADRQEQIARHIGTDVAEFRLRLQPLLELTAECG